MTSSRICEWVTHGRRNLSLALLDFGGRHDEHTAEGTPGCSRPAPISSWSPAAGAEGWAKISRTHELVPVGWMRSLPRGGPQPLALDTPGGGLNATFQVDIPPGDKTNDAALTPLIDALLQLSRPPDRTPYVNLHQSADWHPSQIPDAGGQADKIVELVSRTGVVVLGGAAPIWAYLAGLRCALNTRGDARVFFYDPRQPERLVEIPAQPGDATFPPDALRVFWRQDAGRSVLQIEITTADKFLPPAAAQNLAGAPVPPPAPSSEMGLSGAAPTWLYGTYARWLLSLPAGHIASWDARMKSFVPVWP